MCILQNMMHVPLWYTLFIEESAFTQGTDGLVPIWRRDICNHHKNVGWLARLRNPQPNAMALYQRHGI